MTPNERVKDVLGRYGIHYFKFIQTGPAEYTLEIEGPPPIALQASLKGILPEPFEIKYKLLRVEEGEGQTTPTQIYFPGFSPEVKVESAVTHPAHYNLGKFEVIEVIEDWGFRNNFHRGNALKYLARAGKKDPVKETEDLEKAIWYLKREIEFLQARKKPKMSLNDTNAEPPASGPVAVKPPAIITNSGVKCLLHEAYGEFVEIDGSNGKPRLLFEFNSYPESMWSGLKKDVVWIGVKQ